MREVPLYGSKAQGRVARVDDADYELAMTYRWNVQEQPETSSGPYAKSGAVYLHTLLTGWALTDHKDGDGLNCQRYNMREATDAQNLANQRKSRSYAGKPTQSRYKGVSRNGSGWAAKIIINRQYHYLGTYADEADAGRAYDAAAKEAHGAFARVNFPDDWPAPDPF